MCRCCDNESINIIYLNYAVKKLKSKSINKYKTIWSNDSN